MRPSLGTLVFAGNSLYIRLKGIIIQAKNGLKNIAVGPMLRRN